ncbi:hypothetical protein [Aciditerrimonas ferrireducens]|jgi:hypothetical protein|uniref:hypothetical protein n=1 Tax=Aciditerrimonas ferrireducens TaxID=667306 RepID=UPI0020039EA2|nr:hypothetical protein [Aciditerrimonas ferrireducens]MCK4177150.1 hypothetical protein [Aciditerrimonas ferrireducens]
MEMTLEDLRQGLRAHAGFDGTVPAQVLALLGAQGPWSGRVWDVLQIVAEDHDRMAFLAGGLRPDEVADCVARWVESPLGVPEIRAVIDAGSYDPDPFGVLAAHGLLAQVLTDEQGQVRHLGGEPVGRWVSDQFADAPDEAVLAWAQGFLQPTT